MILIKNIPSTTVDSGTHATGSAVVTVCGLAFSHRFSNTFVVFDLVPLVGLLSLVAIDRGSSVHCSYAVSIYVPVVVEYATLFFLPAFYLKLSFLLDI